MAVFMSGAVRLVLLAVIAVLAGLPILMLMPAWLMGVWAWHLINSGKTARITRSAAMLFAIGAPAVYIMLQWAGMPAILLGLSSQALGVNMNASFAFSDEFLWNAVIGLLCLAHVVGMARLMQNATITLPAVRWFAGASFSIYVTHYPALHLLDTVLPQTAGREVFMLMGSIAVGLVFAALFERRIKPLLQILRSAMTAFKPPKAKAFDNTTSTDASRAVFGTTSSAHSGSGSS